MADVPGKFFKATKVRTGVSPSSPGVIEGETLPPLNPPGGSLNSVGLSMPSAFNVANSPLTSNGTLAVTGAGTVGQYIRGDGSLADFPQASGGGSSVSYYLNGSVNQGTIGGVAYRELSKVPILGAGTDFTINADGYIASFITDAGDPNLLEIPGGNWNFETYFSASSGGGSPTFYVELYKVSGTTATLIASSSSAPELIAFGTNLTPYYSTLAVPTTTLALTDRLAIRYYVTHSGRTITMHTENNHLCQIITTFTTGLTALNGLTAQVQNFAVGTSGTDFNIASATATHTFNLPTASATNRGALSSADWSLFRQAYNDKINSASVTGTTTKTLTLVQQDGGEIQASWSDLNTDAVTSVFGRTGAVVAVSGDYNTSQVTESGNLYFTQARVSANTDVAANTAARHNAVTLGTANGLSLSTQQLSLGLSSGSTTGALSSTDWNTFNNKENAITAGTTAQYFRGDKTFQTLNTGVVPESGNLYFTNARAIASTLTGYVSGAGTISSADSILTAIQKLNGNIGALVTGVSSVNGQTGAVTLTTTNIGEGTNLYFTNARARAALSFAAGSGAYNTTTGVITIPTDNNQIANGANYITAAALSAYLPLAGGTMTGVITTPNGTFGIVIGDDSRLADRNVANTLFLEGVQNNDRGYINFSQTSGNALGAVNGGDLTWRGNVVLHAANFNSYAPTLGGTGATGTWSIAITGNAGTANTWTTARTITIGNTGKSVNGSANVAWSLAEIGAYAASNPSAFIALTALSGVAPIQYNNTTGAISITQASGSTNGFLSSTDWTTFNNKQTALTNPVTGTGTTNYLPKFTGTSTIGNSQIFDNGSGVTINGTNVGERFNVNGYIGLQRSGTQIWHYGVDSSNSLEFLRSGIATRMILSSDGNLGLGVTPSAWMGGSAALQVIRGGLWHDGSGYISLFNNAYYDGSNWRYIASTWGTNFAQVNGNFQWFQAPSGTAGNAISFTQAMTLFATGNLLVGTPSPISDNGARLQVSGETRLAGELFVTGSTGYVQVGTGTLSKVSIESTGTIGIIGTRDASDLALRTNLTTRLTISSTGAATFSSTITATSATANNGSPYAGLFWSGDDSGAIWRGAIAVQHNANTTISAGSSIGIVFSPLASTGSNFYGHAAIKAVRPNATANNQDTDLAFWTRAGASNSTIDSEKMRIFSGGNVFIGPSPSDNGARLQVSGGVTRTTFIQTNTDNHLVLNTTNSGGDAYSVYENSADANNSYAVGRGNDGGFRINHSTGATYGAGTVTNRLLIDSAGAATFSSSVTATQFVANGASTVPNLILNGPSTTWTRYQTSGTDRWDIGNNVGGLSSNQFSFYSNGTNSNVFVIQQNGNVGIGTPNPATRLSVYANNPTTGILFEIFNNATSSQTGAIMKFTQDSVADWGIGQPAATNAFAFWSGTYPGNLGTERMRIFSDGNVLIQSGGTFTNNGARLQVSGTAGAGITLRHSNGNVIALLEEFSGTQGGALTLRNSSGTNNIQFNAGGVSYINGGNVGIGTPSPNAFLDISTGTATDILRFGASSRWGFRRENNDNRYVSFYRGLSSTPSAVWTVDGDNGNVGIGTPSPVARLHAENPSNGDPTSLGSVPTTNVFGFSTSPGAMLAAGIGTAGGGPHVWFQGRNLGGAGVSYPIAFQPLGGNVLIGTTTNTGSRLGIKSSSTNSFPLIVQRSANTNTLAAISETSGGDGSFLLANSLGSTNIQLLSNGTSILNGGNVLIGTTNDPGATLHVGGTIRTGQLPGAIQNAVNWRLGTARGGPVTSNATVRVEIDGVLVDLLARYV